MANPNFLNASGDSTGQLPPGMGPENAIDSAHDGAPGGVLPISSPSVAVVGGKPFTTNGYTPSSEQDQLPTPGSDEGTTRPPDGIRR